MEKYCLKAIHNLTNGLFLSGVQTTNAYCHGHWQEEQTGRQPPPPPRCLESSEIEKQQGNVQKPKYQRILNTICGNMYV